MLLITLRLDHRAPEVLEGFRKGSVPGLAVDKQALW